MGQRRRAREHALQGLYMYEVGKAPVRSITEFDWIDGEIPDEVRSFTVELIEGTISNLEKIDSLIKDYSRNWKPERLTVIDRSILRLAIFEMMFMPDIPTVVTINESIELGKTFGGENSGQFINGILDAVKKHELNEE
ncbi:MAG TPA: transcription antitermination factor NusB [Spirochaetota bacterium]|nr:transcription antitermination factor NusB [Spirochaetota bacterium]